MNTRPSMSSSLSIHSHRTRNGDRADGTRRPGRFTSRMCLADPELQWRLIRNGARHKGSATTGLRWACRCCARECRSACMALTAHYRPAVHRQADRARHHLRRPGGDRDRERAAVRRGAGAHARVVRGAGAADGDLGGAAGHLELARRARACVRGHAGERDAPLRGQVRQSCGCDERDDFRIAARRTSTAGTTRECLHETALFSPVTGTGLAGLLRTKQVVHIADLATSRRYLVERDPTGCRLRRARRRSHAARRADAQGERADRRRSRSIARRSARSPTSRSSWSGISPTRPSSPSRTRACSTSCANRCSSRPPPPTCSRSSAARPSICRPCSIRLSQSAAQLCEADHVWHRSAAKAIAYRWPQATGMPRKLMS